MTILLTATESGLSHPLVLSEDRSECHLALRGDDARRVNVVALRYSSGDCCHRVVVEHGALLKKLDMHSTHRVELGQRFDARAGDQLAFEYVMLLREGRGLNPVSSAIEASLCSLENQFCFSLFNRFIKSNDRASGERIASNGRESMHLTIPATGRYGLHFATAIDPESPGAEAHLLVDDVRVTSPTRTEITQLASLSCVGRVR